MSDLTVSDLRNPSMPGSLTTRRPLNPDEKAAIIVYSLGPERAKQVLDRMDESDYRRFAQAMNRLGTVDAATVEDVLTEFATSVSEPNTMRGGTAETRRFMARFLDASYVDQLLGDISGPAGRDIWEKLSNTSEHHLFAYLSNEQPQSVAVILSRITASKAAQVLMLFSDEKAKEIVRRMSRIGNIDRSIMKQLKTTLQQDFQAVLEKQRGIGRPHDLIGSMFNQMPTDKVGPLMEALQASDPEAAEKVQKMMFTFADFSTRVSSADLQNVIKNCEHETLVQALTLAKRNAPEIMEYFFNNMSKRVAGQMQEQIDEGGPVRMKDAQAAQQEIVRVAQVLAKSGEIQLTDGDSEDDQVL